MKMMLCCGGGFSSSYVATRIQNEIKERGLENEHSIEFFPFKMAMKAGKEKFKDYDVILLCPHLRLEVKELVDEGYNEKPLYLLPPRIYGNMQLDDILYDSEDIIKIFNETHTNPVHFKDEDNVLKIKRAHAYRLENSD